MKSNVNKKIQLHPSIVHTQEVQTICEPLALLGINYFAHAFIDHDFRFSAVGSHPEFGKLYLERGYYNFDLHMARLRIPEQNILWDTVDVSKETKEMDDTFRGFGFAHTFSIIQESPQGKNYYHFAGKCGNPAINNTYLQNLDLLQKFICHFSDKIKNHKTLLTAYDIKFQVDEIGGFFTKNALHENQYDTFNRVIDVERTYLDKDHYITKRELQCLYWLAHGKTFEESATILGITPRTVKEHIIHIKEKFSCTSQFQLGMLYQKLNAILK